MWSDAYPIIEKLREHLLACPSLYTIGAVSANIHFPSANTSGEGCDPLPIIVIAEPRQGRERYAEGALPLISGELSITVYIVVTGTQTAGYLENIGRLIVKELGLQYTGIAWRNFTISLASNPLPGARAEEEQTEQSAIRSITISVQYGLSR